MKKYNHIWMKSGILEMQLDAVPMARLFFAWERKNLEQKLERDRKILRVRCRIETRTSRFETLKER